METLRDGIRHDPFARRKGQRHGSEKGVRIYLSASDLRKAGIDPDGPTPEYKVWSPSKGGIMLRLYV
jgi:hypothetical protein